MKRLINLIKTYKTAVILLSVAFVIVLLAIILNKNKSESPITQIQQNQSVPFEFVRKIPEANEITSHWPVEPVTFVFNKQINPNSIVYQVEPQTETKITHYSSSLMEFSIVPLNGWVENKKYFITINSVSATTGEKLSKPIVTEFTRKFSIEDLPPVSE